MLTCAASVGRTIAARAWHAQQWRDVSRHANCRHLMRRLLLDVTTPTPRHLLPWAKSTAAAKWHPLPPAAILPLGLALLLPLDSRLLHCRMVLGYLPRP
ncbi:hypothetical protein Nepgr_032536 [Nepenthes gracilis]|uniref:Uncharacterized protein n=1 Tax=Nepenthes gracilis TaxID=150966 RepID=A0AAD3TIU2_NEPGR|nr:hypothetical protein Nepgr_032536 [Nepenthes gracilis]